MLKYFFIAISIGLVYSQGCRSLNRCCDQRSDDCKVQLQETACYCDSFCVEHFDKRENVRKRRDCCDDYEQMCKSGELRQGPGARNDQPYQPSYPLPPPPPPPPQPSNNNQRYPPYIFNQESTQKPKRQKFLYDLPPLPPLPPLPRNW
ncbi:hypothetical protein SNEBB_001880 [Seison nebaliae]|nr:hypothetical protein SNEBB_001880 [Seison nebaliae]